jgi:hypothetical protein
MKKEMMEAMMASFLMGDFHKSKKKHGGVVREILIGRGEPSSQPQSS